MRDVVGPRHGSRLTARFLRVQRSRKFLSAAVTFSTRPSGSGPSSLWKSELSQRVTSGRWVHRRDTRQQLFRLPGQETVLSNKVRDSNDFHAISPIPTISNQSPKFVTGLYCHRLSHAETYSSARKAAGANLPAPPMLCNWENDNLVPIFSDAYPSLPGSVSKPQLIIVERSRASN